MTLPQRRTNQNPIFASILILVLMAKRMRELQLYEQEESVSLMRYFLWADCTRNYFQRSLRQYGCVDLARAEGFKAAMYMSLWYGSLYVVIEG